MHTRDKHGRCVLAAGIWAALGEQGAREEEPERNSTSESDSNKEIGQCNTKNFRDLLTILNINRNLNCDMDGELSKRLVQQCALNNLNWLCEKIRWIQNTVSNSSKFERQYPAVWNAYLSGGETCAGDVSGQRTANLEL